MGAEFWNIRNFLLLAWIESSELWRPRWVHDFIEVGSSKVHTSSSSLQLEFWREGICSNSRLSLFLQWGIGLSILPTTTLSAWPASRVVTLLFCFFPCLIHEDHFFKCNLLRLMSVWQLFFFFRFWFCCHCIAWNVYHAWPYLNLKDLKLLIAV